MPGALGTADFESGPDSVALPFDAGRVSIHYQTLEPRRIALISLPRLLVTMRFVGLSREQAMLFLKRFDLYTLRGGG